MEQSAIDADCLNAVGIRRPNSIVEALPGAFPESAGFLIKMGRETHPLKYQRNGTGTVKVVASQLEFSVRKVDLILSDFPFIALLPARNDRPTQGHPGHIGAVKRQARAPINTRGIRTCPHI